MLLALVILGALTTAAAMPFAVVSDPIVAGIFSLFNTILNAATIWMLSRAVPKAEEARQAAQQAADLTAKIARRSDLPRDSARRHDDGGGHHD